MAKSPKKRPGSKPKSAKPPNRKPVPRVSKIVNNKCLVWHIFRFEERFEMDEYRRQGGLDYVRMFVTAVTRDKSNESSNFLQQLNELEHYYPEQRDAYEGRFWRLSRLTATQEDWLRGYLMDAKQNPLTVSKMAARLHLSIPVMKQTLVALKKVGLIEHVECPEFTPPERGKSKTKDKDKASKGTDKSTQKRGIREHSEAFGKIQNPLKKRQTAKVNEKKKVNEQRATNGLTAVNAKEKKNGNSAKRKANVQGKGSSKGQVKGEPPSAPTATPPLPLEPQVSDALGGSKVIPFTAPRTSLRPASGWQRPAAAAVAVGYDRSDEVFGQRVYVALGYRYEISSPEGRREICSFASKWAQARESLARLPPEVRDVLGVRLLEEARKIGRRGKRNKRPGAVWCTVADKLVTARLREAM